MSDTYPQTAHPAHLDTMPPAPKKARVLLSGYYGFDNLGDDLILDVLVRWLKAEGVEPVVLSDTPEATERKYAVPAIERMEVPLIWSTLSEVDGLISGGGGLFQDVTGLGSPIYYGGVIEMARLRNVPTAFFGQGVGPLKTPIGKWFVKRAVNACNLIIVRDHASQQALQRINPRPVQLMADPVWLWEPGTSPINTRSNAICPSIFSSDSPHGVAVSLRPFHGLTDTAVRHLAHCLTQWPDIQEKGVNLIQCQPGTDLLPLSQLETVLKQHKVPTQWYAADQTPEAIQHSEALIGMRFHAILVAAKLGIPLISLSYDPKVRHLAEQLDIADYPMGEWLNLSGPNLYESLRPPNPEGMSRSLLQATHGFAQLRTWLQE